MSWKAVAAIFYEQHGERTGHYWAYCRMPADKNWYYYNDATTGQKQQRLPEGLPNVYAIIYRASDEAGNDDSLWGSRRGMEWDYVQEILTLEAGCTSQLRLAPRGMVEYTKHGRKTVAV